MEYKFTTDGKKVAIVGKLNAQETIVQEIFVTDSGAELPQGENFVVKSLLDEPAKSWKQKAIEEAEQNYETKRKYYEKQVDDLRKRQTQLIEDLKNKVSLLKKMNEKLSIESLDPVFSFLTNQYTHVVSSDYGDFRIMDMETFHTGNGYGLKLVSIYGDDSGDLQFRLNEYRDGSGGWKGFTPFKSYESAVDFLKKMILQKTAIGERDIEAAQTHGIQLPKEMIEDLIARQKEYAQKNINGYQDSIKRQNDSIAALIEKCKSLI